MLDNIKSQKILRMIFNNLKKRVELNILKYNNKMKDKLNIIKKDFEDFLLIKKFNQKFNLNIKDVDIELFDNHEKNFGNEILEYFYEVEFYKLKEKKKKKK